MAKRKKPRYYVAQFGNITDQLTDKRDNKDFNWSIPQSGGSPSVVTQTNTGAKDAYGNQYFNQDNSTSPTPPSNVVDPSVDPKNPIFDLLGNDGKDLNPAIQQLNSAMQFTTGIANMVNENKNRKNETQQYIKAITPRFYENMEGYGLNANPVFTKYGGSTPKYQTGGPQQFKPGKQGPNDPIDEIHLTMPKDAVRQIRFVDNRAASPTTGKAFKERGSKTLNANVPALQSIIAHAKAQGVDPYDALAIAYQESNFGKEDGGFGEVKDYFPDQTVSDSFNDLAERKMNESANVLAKALKDKNAYAKQLGYDKKGDAFRLQSYNGYGKLKPQAGEKTTAFYGIPVSRENPLNMAVNPAYGKTVMSLRDQVLKGNQDLTKLINDTPAFKTSVVGMQTGGAAPSDNTYQVNARLQYYKEKLNNQLKVKNPQGYMDFMKNVQDLRVKGDQNAVDKYIQTAPYNDYLSPDEVKKTLGDMDYMMYNSYLNAAQPKLSGDIEGFKSYDNLNYGRRFAALPYSTTYSSTNTTRGNTYSRSYKYNPKTGLPEWTETGDVSLRPADFSTKQPTLPTDEELAQYEKTGKLQKGGMAQTYGIGGDNKQFANVEAEQGEAIQGQNGEIYQVADDANTHEQGGVFLPDVHRVLENTSNIRKDKDSKALKLDAKQVKNITGADIKGNTSHAEALVKANEFYEGERNKITKKINLAAKGRNDLDKYGELSTKLNLQQFQSLPNQEQLFEQLFNHQEAVKAGLGIESGTTQSKYGGGLSRGEDYGSKSKPYPSVSSGEFAGGGRSYPIPTRADAEDALRLAHLHGRSDVIAKVYEKYPDLKKAQVGGSVQKMQLAGYAGSKTHMKTPKGNSDAFPSNMTSQQYLDGLAAKGFKYEGIHTNAQLQSALYDYKLRNKEFDDLRNMWGEGMHQQGMAAAKKLGFVDDKGMFKPGVLDSEANLAKLAELYPDNMLGPRILQVNKGQKPPRIWTDDEVPADVPAPQQQLDTSIVTPDIVQQPRSKFNEPLRWFDVASPVGAYMAAIDREPGRYNPMEFNQLRYKLLDPTAALQQNQADFNAGVQGVQAMSANNPGGAMANISNLAAQKYAANNQILGNYENQNAQIKNNEITYNTQVRDKNSAADQQAREVWENKTLTAKAIQQEQKLTALDSLYKTIAENRALNRNGNLIMKQSRVFDQYGEYNGYQPIFSVNPALGMPNIPTATGTSKFQPAGGVQQLATGKSYYNRRTGKTLFFDGTKLIER
jgi:hypothetical protein